MSDTFGSEPPDNGAPEGDSVRELPSEDEFSETSTSDEQPASPKRRSPILPIAAAVGGVFLLGSVAWWQFGGTSSIEGLSATNSLSIPSMAIEAPKSEPTPDFAQVTPKTNLADGQKEDDIGSSPLPPPAPSASAPVETGHQNISSAAVPPPSPIATAVAPVTIPAPALPMAPANPAVPAPVLGGPAPVGLIGPAPVISAPPEQRIDALNNRIDSLQKTIDSIAAATPGATDGATPSTKELLDRIDKLEHKLGVKNRSVPAAVSPEIAAEPRSVKAESKHKAVTKTEHKKPTERASRSKLVLRAVSNGQAWVSTSADSADLKQVQVGDKLPGIGRVTEIKMQDDKWVVQGTTGSLQ